MTTPNIKRDEIAKAYQAIKGGGLIIAPSRVGYTLLGNSDQSIEKMFEIKGRPKTKPCVVLSKRSFLPEIAEIPEKYIPLIDAIDSKHLLCGLILKRREHGLFNLLPPFSNQFSKRDNNTSCFVINTGGYLEYLVDQGLKDEILVVGSSANKSGTGNEGIFGSIPENIRARIEYGLEDDEFVRHDYNPETREQGVMIDLTGDEPIVTRRGLKYPVIKQLVIDYCGSVTEQL